MVFSGNKATNIVFLPTATPHGTRTLYYIDYKLCHATCAVWVRHLERAHTHKTFNQIIRWPLTSVHASETLCTLWSLSNPFSIGLTWRLPGPWHPPTHTHHLSYNTLLLLPAPLLVRLNLNEEEINNWLQMRCEPPPPPILIVLRSQKNGGKSILYIYCQWIKCQAFVLDFFRSSLN